MNKKDFKTCMQQGRGGWVLALKSEKNIEKYKDIVLWGCLHNLGYDTQCEGTRAEYVYELTTFFLSRRILQYCGEKNCLGIETINTIPSTIEKATFKA